VQVLGETTRLKSFLPFLTTIVFQRSIALLLP